MFELWDHSSRRAEVGQAAARPAFLVSVKGRVDFSVRGLYKSMQVTGEGLCLPFIRVSNSIGEDTFVTSLYKWTVLVFLVTTVGFGCSAGLQHTPNPATGTTATSSDSANGVCAKYASSVCVQIGEMSPECAAFERIASLLPPTACYEASQHVEYTVQQYKDVRKDCFQLVDKICADMGPKSEVCHSVRKHTTKFEALQCTGMLAEYDDVLADLKRRVAAQMPLDAAKQAAIAAGSAPGFGPANAKATLVIFSDFECPYCSKAATVASQLMEKYGDKVRFVFRQYPLSFHANAQVAAEASLAAHAQGKFWEYHDVLFQNQRALDRPSLETYAKALGLDMGKFKKALDDKTYAPAVGEDMKLGELVAIRGTPSLFLNGHRVQDPTDFAGLERRIVALLAD